MLDCGRKELLAKAMWLPSGDQAGPDASSRGAVSGRACVPLMRATQTCEFTPWNPNRVKLIRRPSGDTFASKVVVSLGAGMQGRAARRGAGGRAAGGGAAASVGLTAASGAASASARDAATARLMSVLLALGGLAIRPGDTVSSRVPSR